MDAAVSSCACRLCIFQSIAADVYPRACMYVCAAQSIRWTTTIANCSSRCTRTRRRCCDRSAGVCTGRSTPARSHRDLCGCAPRPRTQRCTSRSCRSKSRRQRPQACACVVCAGRWCARTARWPYRRPHHNHTCWCHQSLALIAGLLSLAQQASTLRPSQLCARRCCRATTGRR